MHVLGRWNILETLMPGCPCVDASVQLLLLAETQLKQLVWFSLGCIAPPPRFSLGLCLVFV